MHVNRKNKRDNDRSVRRRINKRMLIAFVVFSLSLSPSSFPSGQPEVFKKQTHTHIVVYERHKRHGNPL